jgi:acylphosphatase
MFRDFTQRKATALCLTGRVWNNDDGTVSVVAEGETEKLHQLLALLHKGPILAHVTTVNATWTTPIGEFSDFKIAYR